MSAGARLLAFGASLVALVFAAFAIGRALDSSAPGAGRSEHMSEMSPPIRGEGGGHGSPAHGTVDANGRAHGGMQADAVRGLGVAENGLRLVVSDPDFAAGVTEQLSFQIVDADGRPLTEFDTTHTKKMHVIVVRRDLSGFQHLHPEMTADGTWSVPLRLTEAGTYRVFADFSNDGEAVTLADDLRVDGDADLQELPAPATQALSEPGGFEVSLRADDPHAGEEASLRFAVSRGGQPAALQPYLGAGGHLVALREGDLAFLHVHPSGDGGADGSIGFEATFPTAGNYRLFLQFVVDGELQTVAFTEEVH